MAQASKNLDDDHEPLDWNGNHNIDDESASLIGAFQELGLTNYENSDPLPELDLDESDEFVRAFLTAEDDQDFCNVFDDDEQQDLELVPEDPSALLELLTLNDDNITTNMNNNARLQEEASKVPMDDLPPILYCQPCHTDDIPLGAMLNPDALEAAAHQLLGEEELDESQLADWQDEQAFWQGEQQRLADSSAWPSTPPLSIPSNRPEHKEAEEEGREGREDTSLQYARNNSAAATTSPHRPRAIALAQPFAASFQTQTLRECLGHKERILGCAISPDDKFLATASQDGTVRVWNLVNHRQVSVLEGGHSKEHECLRVAWANPNWSNTQSQFLYLVATGGADGKVLLWGCTDDSMQFVACGCIDHTSFSSKQNMTRLETIREEDNQDAPSELEVPQIYSLQFIDHYQAFRQQQQHVQDDSNSFLLTSSDDHLHLFELDPTARAKKIKAQDGAPSKQLEFRELFSLHFGDSHGPGYGVTLHPVTGDAALDVPPPPSRPHGPAFGGERNPDNLIFVFDASYCPANGLLGAALSDGTLRLMNGRGVCLTTLQLPGCQSHLTSFAWDTTGTRLATTVATGHLIAWDISYGANEHIHTTCASILEGGHQLGRPLFGARYLEDDELLMSWSSDGKVCLWDARSRDEVEAPLAILHENDSYPVFALAASSCQNQKITIAIAGGGSEPGFLGIPVYLQDIENVVDIVEESDPKKPKLDPIQNEEEEDSSDSDNDGSRSGAHKTAL